MSSHVFRKTTANAMDELGPPARLIADQSGTRVSMTQTSTGVRRRGSGGLNWPRPDGHNWLHLWF